MSKKLWKFVLLSFLIFGSSISVFALGGKFNVKIKSISEKNSNATYAKTIDKKINDAGNAEISLEFQRPNDELSYNIVIENTGSKYGTLKDINISNSNKKVSYEVSGIKIGDVLKEDSKATLILKAKVASSELSKSSDKVRITLTYEDEDGKIITVGSNPNTMDNIVKYIVILLASVMVLSLIFIALKKSKGKVKIVLFSIPILIVTVLDVKAVASGTIIIDINTKISPLEVWDGTVSDVCFKKGTGTESDPYKIENGKDLACFAKSVNEGNTYENEYVALTNDIILNENVIVNDELNEDISNFNIWTPAGNEYTKYFSGEFNGNNHLISGIYINDTGTYRGLFGNVKNATIKNLGINNFYVKGSSYVGGLAGYSMDNLTIDNIKSNGQVESQFAAGGMIGYANSSADNTIVKMENSQNRSSVKSSSSVGGLIGFINQKNTEIKKSSNYGKITSSSSYGGGIIGQNVSGNLNIKDVYNTGTVEGTAYNMGGIIGYNSAFLDIENTYNLGNVSSTNSTVGGIIGSNTSSSTNIKDTYNEGNITGNYGVVGGIVGQANNTLYITNAYNKGEIIGSYRVAGVVGYSGGQLEIKDSYNIGNIKGNIESSHQMAGIVGYTANAIIENCYNKVPITGAWEIAGIAGDIESGIIKDSYNMGDITAIRYFGGIAGQSWYADTTIEKSYNTGNIISIEESGNDIGGIVGTLGGTVKKSYNLGNLICNKKNTHAVGGIAGHSFGTIEDSYNMGDISGYWKTGGLVGINSGSRKGIIKNSYNTGNITGLYEIGGIVGNFSDDHNSNGETFFLSNTFNAGNINIKSENVESTSFERAFGGIIGTTDIHYSTDIALTNNYNLGKITLDSAYDNLNENVDYYVGSLYGKIENIKDINITNNNYYVYGDKGIGQSNITDNFTQKININEVPNLLSIINSNNSFKEDVNNINNGYPILK